MEYFVYENWTHKRGRAYRATCSYCNDGKGTQASHSGRNDTWHNCADREAADALLTRFRKNGWDDVKWCARCE